MLFASAVAVTHRSLAPLDLVIIGIYFAIIFGVEFYFAKKERTAEDYFFVSLQHRLVRHWRVPLRFECLACLILLLLGWVFVPFYLRSNVFAMQEFLALRFNRNCANYLATISLITYIFTKISVHLCTAGRVPLVKC